MGAHRLVDDSRERLLVARIGSFGQLLLGPGCNIGQGIVDLMRQSVSKIVYRLFALFLDSF